MLSFVKFRRLLSQADACFMLSQSLHTYPKVSLFKFLVVLRMAQLLHSISSQVKCHSNPSWLSCSAGADLQRHALDVRMSQLFKVGEARPGASRPPAAPRPSAPRPSAPRLAGPKPPPPNSTATLASVSDSAILEHLDKQ